MVAKLATKGEKNPPSQIKVSTMLEDFSEEEVQRDKGDLKRFQIGGALPRCWNCGELGHESTSSIMELRRDWTCETSV